MLFFVMLFQACTNENKKIVEKVSTEDGFCYLTDIKQVGQSVIAKIDLIEYQKMSEINPKLKENQILELPSGFCYLNEKVNIEEYSVADTVSIIMQTFSYDDEGNFNFNQIVQLSELIEFFKTSESERIKFTPFKIRKENNTITSLTQIYIP